MKPIRVNLNSSELAELERELRSEFGPSVISSERAEELKEILDMADKDIEDHESEVVRLCDKIGTVEAEKLRLETQRAKLHSLLSPIRKLPNETLSHILQYVCESNILQTADGKYRARSSLPTTAVSHVCSRWRVLALSSPSLWANIEVRMDIDTFYNGMNTQIEEGSMVARYLERSGDWPLRLSLLVWGRTTSTPFPVPDIFMRHAGRWKTFRYSVSGPSVEYKTLCQLHFPLLSEVDFYDSVTSNDSGCFEHSPRLRTFTSSKVPGSKTLCNQINHLKIHTGRRSLTELAQTLHTCPSLKSLETSCFQAHDVDIELGTLGTWRNITSLTFRYNSLKNVFSLFNFPSLKKLSIEGCHSTVWPANDFISFVSRSSCMITSLTLHGPSLSDMDFIASLRVLPDLLHLDFASYVSDIQITPHLLSSLTIQLQSTSISLVPKLHSLSLGHVCADFDDHAFIRMVESRWFKPGSALSTAMSTMGRACIRSVVLKCERRKVDAEIYKPLRILDAEGLRVVVSGSNGVQV